MPSANGAWGSGRGPASPISDRAPDIRGFTAAPHPEGKPYEVALVTLEMYRQVFRIEAVDGDPARGHSIVMELDIRRYFGEARGLSKSINFPALSVIPRRNGSYTHAQVIDPEVLPDPPWRAPRAIAASPSDADNGHVFYFGGFDAAAPRPIWHNTAWIYRGELSGPG